MTERSLSTNLMTERSLSTNPRASPKMSWVFSSIFMSQSTQMLVTSFEKCVHGKFEEYIESQLKFLTRRVSEFNTPYRNALSPAFTCSFSRPSSSMKSPTPTAKICVYASFLFTLVHYYIPRFVLYVMNSKVSCKFFEEGF